MRKFFIYLFCFMTFMRFCNAYATSKVTRDAFIGTVSSLFTSCFKCDGCDQYAEELRKNIKTISETDKFLASDDETKKVLKEKINELNKRTKKPFLRKVAEDVDDNLCNLPSGCIRKLRNCCCGCCKKSNHNSEQYIHLSTV